MKNLVSIFALLSITSTAFASKSVECSIKNELINFGNIKVDGVATIKISDNRSVTVMAIDQTVRIELNRPATQDEIASAYRIEGRTITEMPIAYTQVNTVQMASSAVLMAEGTKMSCEQK
jgi:hypothetical protein